MFWTSVRRAQMFDQAPENGGFEFRSGFVVDRHDLALSPCCAKLIDIRWELSQILPYRSANRAIARRDFRLPMRRKYCLGR